MEKMPDVSELINEEIEFCNVETGEYFRAIGVTQEDGKTVVQLEHID